MGLNYCQNSCVSVKTIIAANLKALREATPKYKGKGRDALVLESGVPNGPLGRILNAQVNFGVDYLDGFGKAFGAEPWQLLVPTLKVRAGPRGKPIIETPLSAEPVLDRSPQAEALADQLDWIKDPVLRTAAWLEASDVIQEHFRRGNGGTDPSPPPPTPPSDTPSALRPAGKSRA